ncbi:hypothetical protein [Flexibacterium corallicola]|uniref:hypothetical protein n=1 Tax=Flexibacterium corallicola TaxID=3037259 RepID=UPI00286F5450|nr:hypothetical protein [Pseudovibrio sp. M1P-2-3]
MLARKRDLIAAELANGTGASIAVRVKDTGLRNGLHMWFSDLEEKQGPVAGLKPHGLKSHLVRLSFGPFSAQVLAQIAKAVEEDVQLARSLVKSAMKTAEITVTGQSAENWL